MIPVRSQHKIEFVRPWSSPVRGGAQVGIGYNWDAQVMAKLGAAPAPSLRFVYLLALMQAVPLLRGHIAHSLIARRSTIAQMAAI